MRNGCEWMVDATSMREEGSTDDRVNKAFYLTAFVLGSSANFTIGKCVPK